MNGELERICKEEAVTYSKLMTSALLRAICTNFSHVRLAFEVQRRGAGVWGPFTFCLQCDKDLYSLDS
jgi:hypothetical protein